MIRKIKKFTPNESGVSKAKKWMEWFPEGKFIFDGLPYGYLPLPGSKSCDTVECAASEASAYGVPFRVQMVIENCPRDTDGDGNCGRSMCPYCNELNL